MKKYVSPETELLAFLAEDVIMSSIDNELPKDQLLERDPYDVDEI